MVEIQMCFFFFTTLLLLLFPPLFPLIQTVLQEHASDVPKLSYTGEPIVKWPERVSTKTLHFSPVEKNGISFFSDR